ncbi:aspartyl-phosphate phosphatase Spo0E family protein [Neobacillus sp. FSL H8-0543]|uniref:aspartyl-phosphate phosphatase Spo0E family protein n=1 Tax=Neobacillus sp. FSL H8-0543 TaxID=2954672 RepID=UPI0031595184
METNINSLLSTIEKTRIEMIDLAQQYGYSNQNVVQCSQKLDSLLNDFWSKGLKH